ncbi:MAG: ABC transporter ATP-binding protein [Acidimicrobiaceae bacterium]|nr:ABC transporter ATP-binding protein [Acidimicrobiaceae bacterium]
MRPTRHFSATLEIRESRISASSVVEAKGISKSFKNQRVVDDLSFEVPSGSVFGLLGPNGSGKTTTIRMVLGLIQIDSGEASILGKRVKLGDAKALEKVGCLIEGPGFPGHLPGAEAVARLAIARKVSRRKSMALAEAAIAKVGLSSAAGKPVKSYSLGMKQRLGLAQALLFPRELYILDEPTNGLDPSGMKEVREIVGQLAKEGSTVLLSSHLLGEVEAICSHIGIMKAGQMLSIGRISDLVASALPELIVGVQRSEVAAEVAKAMYPDAEITITGPDLLSLVGNGVDSAQLNERLIAEGFRVHSLIPSRRSLEDVFVSLTGEGFGVR